MLSWMGLIWDLKAMPDHIKFSKDKKRAQEYRSQQEPLRPPVAKQGGKPIGENEDVEVYG